MKNLMALDHKAKMFILSALEEQYEKWEKQLPGDLSEDDFADRQNDIGYLGMLITALQDSFQTSDSENLKPY